MNTRADAKANINLSHFLSKPFLLDVETLPKMAFDGFSLNLSTPLTHSTTIHTVREDHYIIGRATKNNDENGIEKGLKQKAVYKSINKLFCDDYSLKPLSINTMLAHTMNCSYEKLEKSLRKCCYSDFLLFQNLPEGFSAAIV
jgi:hypothetical protein